MARFGDGWLSERDVQPGARMRLFCLPHAGSGAAAFLRWKRLLPTGIDVCPVLLPGREMRLAERLPGDAAEIADVLAAAAQPALDVPYAIFGHSMGALLAYAWTVRIQRSGGPPPECLFVSGRNAPHLPLAHRHLHQLGDEDFVAELQRRYGGLPEGFLENPDLRGVFLPVLRADLRAVESYRHQTAEPLHLEVMAFAGDEDVTVSEAGLGGWGDLTDGGFSSHRLAGAHFFHLGSGQGALLKLIGDRLNPSRFEEQGRSG